MAGMQRKRWTQAEREMEIAAWRKSGQRVSEYCVERGIGRSTFHKWLTSGRRRPAAARAKISFAEAGPVAAASPPPLASAETRGGVVVDIGGARVRIEAGADRALVHDILHALRGVG